MTAEACPRPIPFCSLVIQIEPPPIPIFDKISTCICQVIETFSVYNISCTYLHAVAVLFSYEIKGQLLPFCKAFGGVDAKHICTGLYESRDTFCIVSGVDTGAYDITLVFIQQFVRISLMGIVVLTEYEMMSVSVSHLQ